MRHALALLLLTATPAAAWEFTPVPVCTVAHEAADAALRLTHDPAAAQPYSITLTRAVPWPDAPSFAIAFAGPRGLTISTARHSLSNGGLTLTVTDTGFGNVLDGLEFNATATAATGDTALALSLDGAAPAIAAFRACIAAPVV